jgi:fatty acid desaturase
VTAPAVLAVPRLSRDTLVDLSALRPGRFVRMLVADWAVVLGAAALFIAWTNVLTLIVAVVLIGGRQHAFFILMHDTTHFRALTDRRRADRLANLLLAWPLGFSIEGYRVTHLAHHRSTNTEDDPDFRRRMGNPEWIFPMSPQRFYGLFLRDLTGVSLLGEWGGALVARIRAVVHTPSRLVSWRPSPSLLMLAALVAVTVPFGVTLKVLVLWLLPMVTWTEAIVRLRNVSEHFALPDRELLHPTRTLLVSRPVSLLLGLRNANFHVEHHLYPSVPLTRLPDLRAALLRQEGYVEATHTTHGIVHLVRECLGR